MKRIVKSAVVTMLAAAVFVVFGACTAPTQPLEESLYCAKERAIEVYLTQHQKAVDNYAHAMSMIFRMFYNETGMCKTQFEWLRSRGELPTLTQAPYDGFQLQDFARQESSGFRLIRNSILKSFLINKGLFGRFTTDVRWDLYVLHEGDVFFIIRLEEDFREALLLLLDFHGRGGRSVFALGPIVSRDEFGRQQHFGPLTWPVLDWGSPRTVVFFYYICEWYAPVTQDARQRLAYVFELYRRAFASPSINLNFRAYNVRHHMGLLSLINASHPYHQFLPYEISFVPSSHVAFMEFIPNHTTPTRVMGHSDAGAHRHLRGSPVSSRRRIVVNTEYMSCFPINYDVDGNRHNFSSIAGRRSFKTSYLLFAVGRALGLGSMVSHPDFLSSVFLPGFYRPTDFNVATVVVNSHVSGISSLINTRNDTIRHAVINSGIDLRSVMFLPSYNSMRLGHWNTIPWWNRLLPNQTLSAGDIATLRFIYVTHYNSPIWVTRL